MDRAEEIKQFILAELARAAADKGLAPPAVAEDADLLELGLLDSLGFIALLAAIEAHFGLTLDLASRDPSQYTSLGGLVSLALG